jgi:hypothetical protein
VSQYPVAQGSRLPRLELGPSLPFFPTATVYST